MTWPRASEAEDEQDARTGLHRKTRALITRAAGRSFAWADDEITDIDREWTRAYHPGPLPDYAVLGRWLHHHPGVAPGQRPRRADHAWLAQP